MSRGLIRDAEPGDLDALLALNSAAEPGVGAVDAATLERLLTAADAALVALGEDGRPVGFAIALPLIDLEYGSKNFAWVRARGGSAVYLDRIAVAPSARGAGLGAALYAHLFGALRGRASEIVCEVNTVPPNPGSMRFHERLGFSEIGRAAHAPGVYEVAYLARAL